MCKKNICTLLTLSGSTFSLILSMFHVMFDVGVQNQDVQQCGVSRAAGDAPVALRQIATVAATPLTSRCWLECRRRRA